MRRKLKVIGIVAAAVLLAGAIGLAACPPGTQPLNQAPTDLTVGAVVINTPGTYCVPATGINAAGGLTIATSGVTIVGETPDATITTGATPQITINAGVRNTVLKGFRLLLGGAHQGIVDNGFGTQIVDVTLEDTAANNFATSAIDLGGQNPSVRDCTFRMPNSAVPAIRFTGGMGAQILNNEVDGNGGNPTAFVQNDSGAAYFGALIQGNNVDQAGSLVEGQAAGEGFTNSTIKDNVIQQADDDGINLQDNSSNVLVEGNVIQAYDAGGGGNQGIVDGGGSNITYRNNQVTAHANATDDALNFASTNAVIEGNRLDATGAGDAIDASGGASNAKILNNTILGAGTMGGGADHDGIKMTAAANSNFEIRGNTFSNIEDDGIDNQNGGTNHVIENNTITNAGGDGIYCEGNSVIRGNTLRDIGGEGIFSANGNSAIEDNTIDGVTGGDGIDAWNNDQVLNNKVYNVSAGDGIEMGDNTRVEGNEVRNVSGGGRGIYVGSDGGVASTNCEVLNNVVDTVSGGGDGVFLEGGNNKIIGNTVRNIDTGGVGINVDDEDNNEIRDNTIDPVAEDGILVNGGDNNEIVGNTIIGAARDSVDIAGSRFAGIRVVGNADNNVISGNTVQDAGSSTYAVGIDVNDANIENCEITDNTVEGFTTVTGASTTVAIGIRVNTGQNCEVSGNTVRNSGNLRIGIQILTAHEMPVTGNTVEGMSDVGLDLRGGNATHKLDVSGNILINNVTGLGLNAGAAEIKKNKVSGGSTAVQVDRLATAAQFTLRENCFDAPILVRNDNATTLDAKGNFWATAPQAGVNVFGSVDTSDPLASCPVSGGGTGGNSHTYGAAAGWYLVSVPTTGDTASIFGVTLYHWNGSAYATLSGGDALEPGKGYWAYLPANASVTASGTVPTSDVSVDLGAAGWHMISAPWAYRKADIAVCNGSETKTWAEAVAAGWVSDTIWGYDGTNYAAATVLDPWQGYWVRTNVDGLSLEFAYSSRVTTTAIAGLGLESVVGAESLPPAPPSPAAAGLIRFANYPNPVTDVHTTTFRVLGPMASLVSEIKVQVFDLAGKLVWEGVASGAELAWHTEDLAGRYLANGVYLFRIQAEVAGSWVSSGLMKLAIYR